MSRPCWWKPTDRQTDKLTKPSRSKLEVSVGVELQVFADDAAVTERCGDKALVFAGSLCARHTGSRGDTPSESGQILWLRLLCPHPLSVTVSLPFTLCQPSSEAVLIYPISHKQAANEPAPSGLRQHFYWKRKWIRTIGHGVFPIVLSAVYRLYVCESILILDSFYLHTKTAQRNRTAWTHRGNGTDLTWEGLIIKAWAWAWVLCLMGPSVMHPCGSEHGLCQCSPGNIIAECLSSWYTRWQRVMLHTSAGIKKKNAKAFSLMSD